MDIESLLIRHGLIFVVLGCAVEGDTVAITAGVLQHRGLFHLLPTLAAVAAGGWATDLVVFGVGRQLQGSAKIKRVTEARLVKKLLGRPYLLAAVFRFVPGCRTVVPLSLATASPIGALPYAAITFVSACVWAGIMVGIGNGLGAVLRDVFGKVDTVWLAAGAGVVLAVVGALTLWRRRRRASDAVADGRAD